MSQIVAIIAFFSVFSLEMNNLIVLATWETKELLSFSLFASDVCVVLSHRLFPSRVSYLEMETFLFCSIGSTVLIPIQG